MWDGGKKMLFGEESSGRIKELLNIGRDIVEHLFEQMFTPGISTSSWWSTISVSGLSWDAASTAESGVSKICVASTGPSYAESRGQSPTPVEDAEGELKRKVGCAVNNVVSATRKRLFIAQKLGARRLHPALMHELLQMAHRQRTLSFISLR